MLIKEVVGHRVQETSWNCPFDLTTHIFTSVTYVTTWGEVAVKHQVMVIEPPTMFRIGKVSITVTLAWTLLNSGIALIGYWFTATLIDNINWGRFRIQVISSISVTPSNRTPPPSLPIPPSTICTPSGHFQNVCPPTSISDLYLHIHFCY